MLLPRKAALLRRHRLGRAVSVRQPVGGPPSCRPQPVAPLPTPRQAPAPARSTASQGGSSSGSQRLEPIPEAEGEGDEGEFLDDDELDGEFGEEEEAEDVVGELGLGEDDVAPGISSGGTAWGEAGVKAAQKVLKAPVLEGVELYLFRTIVPMKKLDIRLDKLTDKYGSPSIDDIEKFSRMLLLELEVLLGTEAAGEVSLEVSSPGAERQLQLPRDLYRFQQLPLRVEYIAEDGAEVTKVLDLVWYDEEAGTTDWRMADVKANAPVKGRRLSKKQREMKVTIPVANLKRVRIHVDF